MHNDNYSRRKFLRDITHGALIGILGSTVLSCRNSSSHNSDNGNDAGSPDPPDTPKTPIPLTAFYIDQRNGDDKNSGSKTSPWKTISKANQSLKQGSIVFIRNGNYHETISPVNSGASEAPMIFQNFPGENPRITGKRSSIAAIDLRNKSYVDVKGIDVILPFRRYADLTGSSHCSLEDILMKKIGKEHGVVLGTYDTPDNVETSFNKVISCEIHGYSRNLRTSALETLSIFGGNGVHSNLIENCDIINADHVGINLKGMGHKSRVIGPHHNIIRLCNIANPLHHSISENYGANSNLYEYNHILQSGDGQTPENDGEGIHLAPLNSIFRFNIIESSGSIDILNRLESGIGLNWNSFRDKFYFAGNNKFYNNDIKNNRGPGIGISIGITPEDCHKFPERLIIGSEFINNIISGNGKKLQHGYKSAEIMYRFWQSKECLRRNGEQISQMPDDIYRSNNIGQFSGQRVIRIDWPKFRGFYTLEAASEFLPLVLKSNFSGKANPSSNGDYLAFAKESAKESYELKVNDARYFIAPPNWNHHDEIQLNGQRVEIDNIDYKKNIIYLSNPTSWEKGQGVSLKYNGKNPSIGA